MEQEIVDRSIMFARLFNSPVAGEAALYAQLEDLGRRGEKIAALERELEELDQHLRRGMLQIVGLVGLMAVVWYWF